MTDTGTWHASSIDLVQQQVVEHIWKVELPGLDPSRATVPAWDIEVTLDGSRSPYATASFKAPAAYIAETPDGAGTVFTKLVPKSQPPVRIWAGWRHAINGVMTDDLQILFAGFITKRHLTVVEEGQVYVVFEAATAETVYDQPNSRTGVSNVGNTWTSIKQGCEAIAAYATPWYKTPVIVEEAGWMNTPTAAQLTSWRALTFESNDEVGDILVSWAAELGQWIRGNVRSALTTPSLLVSADPYPYRESYALPARIFTKLDRVDDVEQWANVLKFTAQWTDATSGDTVTRKRSYLAPGVAPGNTPGAVRSKEVTMRIKPSGGALTATTPAALAWLRRISDMSEAFYTAQGRAIWWLQPRIHGVQVPDLGLADTAGPLNAVTFQVDSGTMTLAWATNNTR